MNRNPAKILFASAFCLLVAWGQTPSTGKTPTDQAIALFKQRRYAEAKTALSKVVAASPKDAEAQCYLGMVILNFDADPDRALPHLEEAVRLEPQKSQFHTRLSAGYGAKAQSVNLFKAMGWVTRCREAMERGVALDPKDLNAHSVLMQFYLSAPSIAGGGIGKAKGQAAAVANLDAYLGLLAEGAIARKEKDLGKAEGLYRKAIAQAPVKLQAYNELGYVLLRGKRPQEAVEVFRKAVQVDPTDANAHDSLGEGLLAVGQLDSAVAEYRRALEINPWFSESYPSLAQCYLKKNDFLKARQAYEKYLELAPHGSKAGEARKTIAELKGK